MDRFARIRALASLALFLVGGCAVDGINGPAEGSGSLISASVRVPVAAPGEVVGVRFINAAPYPFTVAPCFRRVERREAAEWVLLPEELRMCLLYLTVVGARSELLATTDVPSDLPPGDYRFRFSMSRPTGASVDIVTPAFRVE